MNIGKVLGGTVIATPAVGGGGYVIYKEVTKEEATTTNLPTGSTEGSTGSPDSTSAKGEPAKVPVSEGDGAAQNGAALLRAESSSSTINDGGEVSPPTLVEGSSAGPGEIARPNPENGLGSSGGSGNPGA